MRRFAQLFCMIAFLATVYFMAREYASAQSVRGVVPAGSAGAAAAVEGISASGGAPTNPIMMGVTSAGTIVSMRDAYGLTDAATGSGVLPVMNFIFNGATWDRQYGCTINLPVTLSASGSTEIIPLSGTTIIRICSLTIAGESATNVKLVRGTGTNCATSPADMTGLLYNATSVSLDFPTPNSAMRAASGQAVCVNLSSAVNWGGVVSFAQF